AAALVAAVIVTRGSGARCDQMGGELSGAWDPARRAVVLAALDKASGAGPAQAASAALDRYAESWVRSAEAVCLARATRAPEAGAGPGGCPRRGGRARRGAGGVPPTPAPRRAPRAPPTPPAARVPDECRSARPPVAPTAAGGADRLQKLRGQVSM